MKIVYKQIKFSFSSSSSSSNSNGNRGRGGERGRFISPDLGRSLARYGNGVSDRKVAKRIQELALEVIRYVRGLRT
jgi:hypothetical protein